VERRCREIFRQKRAECAKRKTIEISSPQILKKREIRRNESPSETDEISDCGDCFPRAAKIPVQKTEGISAGESDRQGNEAV